MKLSNSQNLIIVQKLALMVKICVLSQQIDQPPLVLEFNMHSHITRCTGLVISLGWVQIYASKTIVW